jgi:hypothetical protein
MNGTAAVFEAEPSAAEPSDPVRPPRWPVVGATVFLVISAAMLVLEVFSDQTSSMLLTGLGYVAGSLGVSVLVVVHRMRKQRAEQSLWYEPRRGLATAARVVLMLGLLAGLGNAFFLATEIAKQ